MNGHSRPTKREDVFRIAFALDLSEAQTNRLLGVCTDYGIHYRNGRDVIYAWFLRNGGTYAGARDFFEALPEMPRLDALPENASSHLTHELQSAFLQVHSTAELRECYIANLGSFGALHMRAYGYFRRYLDRLIHPVPAWTGPGGAGLLHGGHHGALFLHEHGPPAGANAAGAWCSAS